MSKHETVIKPDKKFTLRYRELWEYRDLFFFLAWRDIIVRYKQTIIGITWSILKPLLSIAVFTIIFGKIAKLPSGETPYSILVFAGLIPWQFFSSTFSGASNSLIANTNLISKVYFPRIIIPSTALFVSLVDLGISIVILLSMMAWYNLVPDIKICLLPLLLLVASLTSLGAGYIASSINVKYRDFKIIAPVILQLGLYISPVGFGSSIIPDKWRLLYSLNPMVGVIDGFRWILLGENTVIYWPGFILSITFSILIFFAGVKYFYKTERSFADTI